MEGGWKLEGLRLVNGDDELKQYKRKISTANRFGSNIMLLLQTWIINV